MYKYMDDMYIMWLTIFVMLLVIRLCVISMVLLVLVWRNNKVVLNREVNKSRHASINQGTPRLQCSESSQFLGAQLRTAWTGIKSREITRY